MNKNCNNNPELNKHKRSDTIKWVAIFLIVILLAVAVFALCANVFNLRCVLGHDYGDDGICIRCGAEKLVEDSDEDSEVENDVGGMTVDAVSHGNSIALLINPIPVELFEAYAVASNAESATTLTAKVVPSDAISEGLSWSVAWSEPSNTWAKGKEVTDYVTVAPQGDNSEAVVSCLQAFGEEVVVTVSFTSHSETNASATFGYRRRLIGAQISVEPELNQGENEYVVSGVCTPTFSVGTGDVNYSTYRLALYMNTDLLDILEAVTGISYVGASGNNVYKYVCSVHYMKSYISIPTPTSGGISFSYSYSGDLFSMFGGSLETLTETITKPSGVRLTSKDQAEIEFRANFYYALKKFIENNPSAELFTLKVWMRTYSKHGVEEDTSFEKAIGFNTEYLSVADLEVSLDSTTEYEF